MTHKTAASDAKTITLNVAIGAHRWALGITFWPPCVRLTTDQGIQVEHADQSPEQEQQKDVGAELTVNDLSIVMQRAYFREWAKWEHNSSVTAYTKIHRSDGGVTVEFSCFIDCFRRYHGYKIEITQDGEVHRVAWDKENTEEVVS